MAVRNFVEIGYMPILTVRPAEMRALEELPEHDKNELLPFIFVRPWLSAHYLDSSLSRLEEAYQKRPVILDVSLEEMSEGRERPVTAQLAELREPDDGYRNWVEFVAARANVIPSLQLSSPANLRSQSERLAALGRGVVIRIPEPAFGLVEQIAQIFSGLGDPSDICFIIDYERQSRELLTRVATASGIVETIFRTLPGCFVSLSASSFPDSFVGINSQDIYERQFFDGVTRVVGPRNLIYGDRGSARAERQTGGGGQPAPRIDYAGPANWAFFREDDEGNRLRSYQRAAIRAMGSSVWDGALRLWGTQMIERTALADPDAIISPLRSTAARINIHLHQQLFHGRDPRRLYDTDEDWND